MPCQISASDGIFFLLAVMIRLLRKILYPCSNHMSLAQEILQNSADPSVLVSALLRKFKVFVSVRGDEEKIEWVNRELKGYRAGIDSIPDYRTFQAHNLGHFNGAFGSGLKNAPIPLFNLPDDIRSQYSLTQICEGIEEVESLLEHEPETLKKHWPPDLVAFFQREFYENMVAVSIWQSVPRSALTSITSAIRDEIADYILALQKINPDILSTERTLDNSEGGSLLIPKVRRKQRMPEKQLKVFLSYSHADETYKNDLDKHFASLRRNGYVSTWNDRMISGGSDWENEIDENIKSADIILLLISADFIDSDYCYGREMNIALDRHDNAEAIVVPIIVRHTHLDDTPFMSLQAFPKDARPISSFADRDEAYAQIARAIQGVAINFDDTLKKRRG